MTDSDERRKMALQINPNIANSVPDGDVSAQSSKGPSGTPDQNAAKQFADLLQNPADNQDSSTPPTFANPFSPAAKNTNSSPDNKSIPNQADQKGQTIGQEANSSLSPTDNSNSQPSAQNTQGDSKANVPPGSMSTNSGSQDVQTTGTTASATPTASIPTTSTPKTESGTLFTSDFGKAAQQTTMSTNATPQSSNQSNAGPQMTGSSMPNTSIGGNSNLHSAGDLTTDMKPTSESKIGADGLTDAQLAAAANMNAAVGVQANPGASGVTKPEEVEQPHVDGEKIEAMMKSVTKELGMRDLSQLKLGGEMTLKLDQGALPNTEVKVRFEGNQMVISIDSKTADVNQFCTDNLALLQQSVSSGMKDDMKVRIEIRNPPEQPNQRKDEQGGQGQGHGGQGSNQGGQQGQSRQQSQNNEGDSLAG